MATSMDPTAVKAVEETVPPAGATRDLTGTDPEEKTVQGTGRLVKEGGDWRTSQENWQL